MSMKQKFHTEETKGPSIWNFQKKLTAFRTDTEAVFFIE